MFGEYMVYLNDRPVLLVCDDTPFVKMLPCVEGLLGDRPSAAPYEGAKPHYVLGPGRRGNPAPGGGAGVPKQSTAQETEEADMREQADREKFQYLPTAENGFLLLGKSEEGGWTVLEESGPSPGS